MEPAVLVGPMAEFIRAAGAGIALERAANPKAVADEYVAGILPRALGLSGS